MKEGQKLQGIRQERSPFKTQGPLSLNDDGDGSRVPGSAGKYWRYEQDDLHEEGWDEELGVPRVIVSETENLLHAMTRHIRNASHYGQRRLASVLNRSAVIYEGEICVFREDEKQGRARGAPPGLRSGGAGSSERDLSSRSEESLCALADEDLREGSTCTAVYPSEYPGKWEVEHFRVIYFGTLRESLCNLLGRLGAAGLHASCFTDIRLAQYCPTIFWNIARIFHWEIDLGILEILPSASPTTLKRRRGSLGETPGRPASRPTPGKKAGAGPQSRGVDAASEERDVSQELSKRLVEDLQRKVPYFVRNGIDCYTGPECLRPPQTTQVCGENSHFKSNRPSNIETEQPGTEEMASRRSSRRVSFRTSSEASVIEAFIDQHYRVVRLPIFDYPERLKRTIYKYCISNGICSCTLIKRDPLKGRCVIAGASIRKDDFVLEYKGNLISQLAEAKRLEETYACSNQGCYMYYFKCNGKNYCIDATEENIDFGPGRLINHSRKNPNIITKVLMVGAVPRLFFVSKRDIACGEELLFDYGDNNPVSTMHNPWLLD